MNQISINDGNVSSALEMGVTFVVLVLDEVAAWVPVPRLIGELVPNFLTISFVRRLSDDVCPCSVLEFSFGK